MSERYSLSEIDKKMTEDSYHCEEVDTQYAYYAKREGESIKCKKVGLDTGIVYDDGMMYPAWLGGEIR